jgi:hypothetical protein
MKKKKEIVLYVEDAGRAKQKEFGRQDLVNKKISLIHGLFKKAVRPAMAIYREK